MSASNAEEHGKWLLCARIPYLLAKPTRRSYTSAKTKRFVTHPLISRALSLPHSRRRTRSAVHDAISSTPNCSSALYSCHAKGERRENEKVRCNKKEIADINLSDEHAHTRLSPHRWCRDEWILNRVNRRTAAVPHSDHSLFAFDSALLTHTHTHIQTERNRTGIGESEESCYSYTITIIIIITLCNLQSAMASFRCSVERKRCVHYRHRKQVVFTIDIRSVIQWWKMQFY